MEEKELKTSVRQRVWIGLIAVIMLGSMVASYAAILMNSGSGSDTPGISQAKLDEYLGEYEEARAELKEAAQSDFNEFVKYKSKITAYNEAAANGIDVKTEDLKKGTGRKITDGDANYLAYYVGWCADESVFDSSYDSESNPKGFTKILDASGGMIEGWTLGVEGMRLDGIRIITIPGSLAYKDSMEICGGYNKPLKFMVMLKEKKDPLLSLSAKVQESYMRYEYARMGYDYDEIFSTATPEE